MNPRSLTYKIYQRLQAAPWLGFSIGMHAVIVMLLMNVRAGGPKYDDEDIIIETQILDQEDQVIDPEIIEEIFDKEVTEVEVEESIMEPQTIDAAMPNENIVPMEDQEVGDIVDEDELSAEDALEESINGITEVAIGDMPLMVVSGNDSGMGRNVGSFGLRRSRGAKKNALKRFGGSRQSENAVMAGLAYLAKVQQKDGHWSSNPKGGSIGSNDVAITGLCLLGFLGAGHTESSGRYRSNVQRAVTYLRRQQAADGAWLKGGRMYGHGIVSMAMSEAYGMAGGRSIAADAAQGGINFIVKNQGTTGGFGYGGAGNDMSVTGWQIMACKSAKVAGLRVPKETFEKFEKYLDEVGDQKTGKTGYSSKGNGSIAMTSAGLVCRLFLGEDPENSFMQKAADLIIKTGPHVTNEYYVYYGTLGIFQMGGKRWSNWNESFSGPIIMRQVRKGRMAGSWPLQGSSFGNHGAGTNYVTAMYILSLEVYYRYLPVYRN